MDLLQGTLDPADSWISLNLSHEQNVENFLSEAKEAVFHRFIYFAGGGPYGPFQEKAWKDHQWAWNVTFLSAARFFHTFLKIPHFRQGIAIGSQVAENHADSGAASYAAAKHALRGLVLTLQKEGGDSKDLRLFSPGYMNTNLLPPAAWPRQAGLQIHEPDRVAQDLALWMQDSKACGQNWSKGSL